MKNTVPTLLVVELPIREQVCKDFLTSCIEGASTYWLGCKRVTRDPKTLDVLAAHRCFDYEDRSAKFDDITLDTMRLGIQRLLAPGADVASNIKTEVLAYLIDEDSSAWDAWTADAVLQFGLLGSLVYG